MERAREQMGNGLPSFTGKFQTLLGFLAPAGFVLSAVWRPSSPKIRVVSRSLAGCRTGRAQSHTLHPTGSAKLSNTFTGCFAPSSAFKPSPPPAAPFFITTGQT